MRKQLVPAAPTSASAPPFALHRNILGAAGELISLLDNLRANPALRDLRLDFPRIVVVGEENSGKSSLLERIALTELFPKGKSATDICTRSPIVLNLKHVTLAEVEVMCRENNVPMHNEQLLLRVGRKSKYGQWCTSIPDFENAMRNFMNLVVTERNGSVSGITEEEITVEVVGNVVPNLTLVDLPGIFGGRRAGEPENISEQTMSLARKYISQPHTLILAVVPAFVRPRNTFTARLIQEAGKEQYTIGVLTMADRANTTGDDPFAELKARLDGTSGDIIDLPHGWLCVRNRDSKVSPLPTLLDFAGSETTWLDNVLPGYRAKHRAGANALIERLVGMLCKHVAEKWVPDAERQLRGERTRLEAKLAKLGDDPSAGDIIAFARRLAAHWRERLQRVMSAKNAQQLFESPSVRELRYENNHVTSSMSDIPQWLQRKADILKGLEKLVEAFVGTLSKEMLSQLSCEDLPLRCARFTTLRAKLEGSLNRRITELSRSICARLPEMLRGLFPFIEATGAGVNLVNPTLVLSIEEVISASPSLLRLVDDIEQLPSLRDFLMEDPKIATERATITGEIRHIDQLVAQVNELRKFGSPTSPLRN